MAKLFSKEKDKYLKAVNMILILLLIGASIITLATGVYMINDENIPSYKEYKTEVCALDKIPEEEIDSETTESNCYNAYLSYKKDSRHKSKANNNNFIIGLYTIIILSVFMALLNKKTK